jgi:hypothetical protein
MRLLFHCDNVVAINITNNPVQFDHTKHMKIAIFFIKEKIDMRVLKLEYISILKCIYAPSRFWCIE